MPANGYLGVLHSTGDTLLAAGSTLILNSGVF
jgi:hypothetical protein